MSDSKPAFLFSYLLDGNGGGDHADFDAVCQWTPDSGTLWVHVDVNDDASRQWLRDESGVPDPAVDLMLAGETRPRALVTDTALLIVLRGVNTNPGDDPEDMVSVRIWTDGHRIVSARRRRLLSIVDVSEALQRGNGPTSPSELLTMVVERLSDRIGAFVDTIEASLDQAEDDIRDGDPNAFRPRLAALRRQIAAVRRFLSPQREALDRVTRQSIPVLNAEDVDELHQEADRVTRYLEDLDLARERAIVLHEELLSQIAQEQNSRMYLLSVVAAVFLPLTFVTGLLGMNVGGLPGLDNPEGFNWSMAVMVGVGVGMVLYFRYKRWL